MKKIKENTYTTKLVEVEMYQTEDGKKFSKEEDATKHEENVKNRKIIEDKYEMKKLDVYDYGLDSHGGLSSNAFYIEELNDETKKDLMFLYPYLAYNKSKLDEIKTGWNIFVEEEYDSCGLSRWSGYELYIYNVKDLITQKKEEIERLEKL